MAPLGLLGGFTAAVAAQIGEVSLQGHAHRGALDAADGGPDELREPSLGLAFGLIELERRAEGLVLLFPVTAAEACDPSVGPPAEPEESALADPLIVRSDAAGEPFAFALARKIRHFRG